MKILIYDVHASESGALAILDDLYKQVFSHADTSIEWIFVVSTPVYKETKNIKIIRHPWVKKNWFYRLYFDTITTRKILKEHKPDKIISLQNKGISFSSLPQLVYLHLPFVLCDYQFNIKRDGKVLWLYQNVLSKFIFKSLRKVDKTIVQTQWMKNALMQKANVKEAKIEIIAPDITTNNIQKYKDSLENRKRFFYPATSFTYKNHQILLEAFKILSAKGFNDYEVLFTIKENENKYTVQLSEYAKENNLNITFNGPIKREKVFDMYANSVLIFPSFVESFGLPLLEARLSGSFIVANRTSFSEEILRDYENSLFFNGDNALELANCIKKMSEKLYLTPKIIEVKKEDKKLIDMCTLL